MSYRGMWKKPKIPLSQMNREEVVKELRSFRNAWEKITERDQDLSNERLSDETLPKLKKLLKNYYGDVSKAQAKQWLGMELDEDDEKSLGKRFVKSKSPKKSKKSSQKRPSPSSSATEFKVGTKRKGGDGNMWVVTKTSSGIQRWKRV